MLEPAHSLQPQSQYTAYLIDETPENNCQLLIPFLSPFSPTTPTPTTGLLGSLKGLLKVGDDVVNVLGTLRKQSAFIPFNTRNTHDRDTDHVLSDTRRGLLVGRELLVRGGPGVDSERLGVTDVGHV